MSYISTANNLYANKPRALMPETDQPFKTKFQSDEELKNLYVNNYTAVEHFVLQNSGSVEDAKDIYQEAFLAVWRNLQLNKFAPQFDGALGAYLIQIARNKWIDHLRSSRYKKTLPLPENQESLMTIEETNDTTIDKIKNIKEQFRQLGEQCKDLLERFYYEKQPLKEIAAALNWTEATAKNNKYRCMERLRALIKNQH